jgi:probable F420-dependent oxidoreductase
VLGVASQRAAGAHSYLVTPAHTRHARKVLGPGSVLAPEHKVVLETDAEAARAIGRPYVQNSYLQRRNYVNNLLRLGYTEQDVQEGGSDRLIDDLVLHGTPEKIARGLAEHRAAGADHVGVQVFVWSRRRSHDGISCTGVRPPLKVARVWR